MMSRHGGRAGWSLVELLVAMVSAAVLSLTVGAMLVFTCRAWQRHLALADMQGDVRVAVPTLCMAIRESRASEARTNGTQLILGRRVFSRSGRRLMYDPDTNVVNNDAVLSRDRVTDFRYTLGTNAVWFRLVLQEQGATVDIDSRAFFRN